MGSRFSCVSPWMERLSLDLPRTVKNRQYALEVGCGGVVEFVIAGNLKLEQALRNLACGDR